MGDTKQTAPDTVDIAVIDDEESIREGCRRALESVGYRALVASDGKTGLAMVAEAHPRVVLLDLRMPGVSGIEVLERLPGIDPRIVPIVITGYGSVSSAVSAMKLGAFDFINKPFDVDQLLTTVERGLGKWQAFAPAPAVEMKAPKAPAPKPSEPDVLLEGLESLEHYYGLGERHSTLERELHALESEADFHASRLGDVREREELLKGLVADLRLTDSIITRHEFKKNALIQILLDLQAAKNWLPQHALSWISRRLGIPMSRILEVATFYEAFSLVPQGKHTVQVCTGTACHVRHAPELSAMVSAVLGIKPGETDKQMKFTLKQVHCLGCCALAPVLKLDDTYVSNPSLSELEKLFASCEPNRGA